MSAIIFYERTGAWATAWRRLTAAAGSPALAAVRAAPLRETRSLGECRQALAETRSAMLVLELDAAQADGVLELLGELPASAPQVAAGVVTEASLAHYEWLARELGAVHFVAAQRKLPELIGVAQRHLQRLPPRELELHERVWQSLPWSGSGTELGIEHTSTSAPANEADASDIEE